MSLSGKKLEKNEYPLINYLANHEEICALGEKLNAEYHPLVGDGFCNEETNNAICNFDGGDCCGVCVNTDHCSDPLRYNSKFRNS